jgi:hypothetical protein
VEFSFDLFETSKTLEDLLSFLRPKDRGPVGGVGEETKEIAIPKEHVALGEWGNGFPDLEFGYGGKERDLLSRASFR